VAAAGCVLAIFKYVHQDVLFPQTIANRDYAGAQAVLDRLDWVSQVSEEARADVDRAVEHERRLRAEYDRRLQRRMGLIPDATAQFQRAERLAERGEWREAARAYEAGLEIDPTNASLLRGAGVAWLALDEPERAIAHLERAAELHPWDRASREALERARTEREPPHR
jgi:tetratricopeptide (TPR) repeat protein